MDLNDRLKHWKAHTPLVPREEALQDTLERSREAWFRQEQTQPMSGWAFLWSQFLFTRKRWWLMQGALLLQAAWFLPQMQDDFQRVRGLGVIGCLFVILLIPELWRNRDSGSEQVEAACFYSLRQVYAARIALFGTGDLLLLSLFCRSLRVALGLSPLDVVSQFLLPVTVTACICLRMLRGRAGWRGGVCLGTGLLWCGVWWLILMNETLYARILPPVWVGLFLLAVFFLVLGVRRTLDSTNQCWEAEYA